MELLISIFGLIIFTIFISIQWVNAIDYMQKNHPNYKGEDLFDEDLTTKEKKPTKEDEKNKGTD